MRNMKQWAVAFGAGLAATCLVGCAGVPKSTDTISKAPFGKTKDGTPVEIYTLHNRSGMTARICTYGGIVQSLTAPDRNGHFADIVLGYDDLNGYLTNSPYFGALIGRYGNRIGGAKFTLEGKTYTLPANDGKNTLHGGTKGFDKVVWTAKPEMTPNGPSLVLNYLSKDGEQGFPGDLSVTAVYTLTDNNELKVEFTATTDKPTVCNLTHHSYWSLRGQGNGDILGNIVYINSDKITPVDSGLIPTGEYLPVEGTPFDFRKPTAIGARINETNTSKQLSYGPGYDHNWVINKPLGEFGLMARVEEPDTGRVMEVLSDQPGLQFYSGNFLDGTITGKDGKVYQRHYAFCMEPQHYPDSPNKPQFPTTELKPGQTYHNTIVYRFSTK